MVRAKQGGSVLSFIIIGVVMVALLVGGAYYVQRQTALPAMDPSQPAPQPEEKTPEEPSKQPAQGSPADKKEQEPAKQQPNMPPRASSDTDSELPRTGPAELGATLLGLGLLSATAVSYLRSRRVELSL